MINLLGLPREVDEMMDIEDQYTHVSTCTRIHTHTHTVVVSVVPVGAMALC